MRELATPAPPDQLVDRRGHDHAQLVREPLE
jgi:hypothetical protein